MTITFFQRALEAAVKAFSEAGDDCSASEQLERALTAALAVDGVALQGWQPIESAPKDGGYIVTNRKRQVAFCDMQSGCRIIHNVAGFVEWDWDKPATHWQPLPHPPAASEGEERNSTPQDKP